VISHVSLGLDRIELCKQLNYVIKVSGMFGSIGHERVFIKYTSLITDCFM
jgi:hypothetical protein